MIDSVLPAGYLQRSDVLDRLKISDATLERMTREERLRSQLVPRERRKPERVYAEADVERLKEEKEKRRALRPPSAQTPRPPGELAPRRTEIAIAGDALALFRDWFAHRAAERPVALKEKLWLTIDEAEELSGRSRAWLLRACHAGTFLAERDGGWKILRSSLEQYAPAARKPQEVDACL